MSYERVGAEKDSFDPTEHGGVGVDSESEAKDCQDRKARTASKHPDADAEVLQYALQAQRDPDTAGVFASECGATHATVGGVAVAGLLLEHLAVKVHFFGKFGVLAALAEEVANAASQAHDITFWMATIIRPNSRFSAASCLRPAAVSL